VSGKKKKGSEIGLPELSAGGDEDEINSLGGDLVEGDSDPSAMF